MLHVALAKTGEGAYAQILTFPCDDHHSRSCAISLAVGWMKLKKNGKVHVSFDMTGIVCVLTIAMVFAGLNI